ncbi:MAG: toprim domain-containing protein [Candidatus Paceibacterota bacterium]
MVKKSPKISVSSDSVGYSDADKLLAKSRLREAFEYVGLVSDLGLPVCPSCGTGKKGKVVLKASSKSGNPYWKCHKCSERGDAIGLLTLTGLTFPEAMDTLLGKNSRGRDIKKIKPVISITDSFIAVVDVEVYNYIRDLGSVDEAVRYYNQWHISGDVVKESGSTYLLDCAKIHNDLIAKFGRDRLFSAGVITVDKNGNDFFLFNDDYPVIEPHLSPNGHVVGMQFRPSYKRMEKVQAHKRWKKRWSGVVDTKGVLLDPEQAWREAYERDPVSTGEREKYVAPFLSLKGAGTDSLVGCGAHALSKLKSRNSGTVKVFVVEGFKDYLAARTLGVNAYAIPGTGVMPPKKVCNLLKSFLMVVTLDGDEAGAKGRSVLLSYFKENGVNAVEKKDIREGMDVTDILVEVNAHAGCRCVTCTQWIEDHPYKPETCPCVSCKRRK